MTELTYKSATQLAQMIRDKKASSLEVVDAHIARIEAVNPKLNAVVQLRADSARASAVKADESLARGDEPGPLHGVPFTVKDSIAIEGVISTAGTAGRANHVSSADPTVVARMRAAGAIPLAATNVPELCLGAETDNLVYGRTNNPYDLTRTPGGSSGGEAALIASGGSPLGLGSDVGGSIRQPAHYCGIAGIKPTSGRVPSTGHWPPLDGLWGPMFKIGPMARFVEDLALTLPIIAGPDWRDPRAGPVPLRDPGEVELAGLRLGFFTDNGNAAADADTVVALNAAADALAGAGVEVRSAMPRGAARANDMFKAVLQADGGAGVRELLEEAGTSDPHPLIQLWLDRQGDSPLSAAEFAGLLAELDQWRGEMLTFFADHDAILCPVWATPAIEHGKLAEAGWPDISYTRQFNLTGWPGAVVRAGTSGGGLPIGVQIVAAPWREDIALALAGQVEYSLGGWQAPTL